MAGIHAFGASISRHPLPRERIATLSILDRTS